MTVTFKIGTTDVTPSYSTINPISGTSASSGSWRYYVYYPLCLNTTNLSISYSGLPSGDAYMCFQASGGSFGTITINASDMTDSELDKSLEKLRAFLEFNYEQLSEEQKDNITIIIDKLTSLTIGELVQYILDNVPQETLATLSLESSRQKLQDFIFRLTSDTINALQDNLVALEQYIQEIPENILEDQKELLKKTLQEIIRNITSEENLELIAEVKWRIQHIQETTVGSLIGKILYTVDIADPKRIISAGGGGGGGQVHSVPLADTGSLSVTIYALGSEIDSIVMDASGNTSVGVGKNGSNAIIKHTFKDNVITSVEFIGGDGGNGGNASSNCKGGGGGNGGSYSITNNDLKNINGDKITIKNTTGTPGVGYNSGSSGSTGDNTSGYVSIDFEDGTTAKLGSGGQEKKSGNTPFVMVYYKV
jgi:hypothetical protein